METCVRGTHAISRSLLFDRHEKSLIVTDCSVRGGEPLFPATRRDLVHGPSRVRRDSLRDSAPCVSVESRHKSRLSKARLKRAATSRPPRLALAHAPMKSGVH